MLKSLKNGNVSFVSSKRVGFYVAVILCHGIFNVILNATASKKRHFWNTCILFWKRALFRGSGL